MLTILSTDIDWYIPAELPYGGSYWGPAEVVDALRQIAESFDEFRLEVNEAPQHPVNFKL